MAGQTPNLSFVRDGRPLHEWLVDLISSEPGVRSRAGDAVSAMFHGLASVHAEPEDVEGELPAGEAHTDAWREAVREAVSRPEFPRRTFFRTAAAQLVGAHADWMRLATTIDPQYERVLARLQARAAAARSDDERHGVSRRIGRAARASCGREQARQPPEIEAFSMGNIALGWVIESAGPALLEAPEAIWMLLEMRGQEYLALKAIERIGADAAPMFGDWFLNGFDAGMPGVLVNGLDALVAVLRDDPRLHRRVLDRLESTAMGEQAV